MQTIHADSLNQCQNELSNLKTDGAAYLTNFKSEQDINHGYVKAIKDICDQLIAALNVYTAKNYGANLQPGQLKSEVNTFAVAFFPQFLTASDLFTRLENGIATLVELTACLVARYNIACKDGRNLKGCASNLNNARCTLAKLTDPCPDAAKTALNIIRYLKNGANTLNQQTRAFSAKYYLACESDGDTCQCGGGGLSVISVKNFFKRFQRLHDDMHVKFVTLENICNGMIAGLEAVLSEFSSL